MVIEPGWSLRRDFGYYLRFPEYYSYIEKPLSKPALGFLLGCAFSCSANALRLPKVTAETVLSHVGRKILDVVGGMACTGHYCSEPLRTPKNLIQIDT
jgi:hypothetical protein